MKNKIKVGDLVKRIASPYLDICINDIGIVVEIKEPIGYLQSCKVFVKNKINSWCFDYIKNLN